MKPMQLAYWLLFLLVSFGAGFLLLLCCREAVLPVAFWGLCGMIAGSVAVRQLRAQRGRKDELPMPLTCRQWWCEALLNLLVWGGYLLLVWLLFSGTD